MAFRRRSTDGMILGPMPSTGFNLELGSLFSQNLEVTTISL